jgi:hypothetical protein
MDNYRFCSKCQKFILNEVCTGNDECPNRGRYRQSVNFCKDSKNEATTELVSNKYKAKNGIESK